MSRRFRFFRAWLTASLFLLGAGAAPAAGIEVSGYAAGEFRIFFHPGAFPEQEGNNLSLAVEPEFYQDWADGDQSILFVPFFRLDQNDPERTHLDIREFFWLMVGNVWEFRVGLQTVFWGVAESQHLVDILNQTDFVENPDGEDKLGQPMVTLAIIQRWGTVDLYVLPWFRERTFPGPKGRFRFPISVDRDRSIYESSAEQAHLDYAARWSHSLGPWDLGLSFFTGTSRDPNFIPGTDGSGNPVLRPVYEQIDQGSLDLQMTTGGWLWKLETLYRARMAPMDYWALVAGFEYTFWTLFDSNLDLGILAEYHYDGRGQTAITPFDDDIFLGTRLAFNDVQDTQILAGGIVDRNTGAYFFNLEGSRRLGSSWTLEVQLRAFGGAGPGEPLFSFQQDDVLQLVLARHF